MVVQQILKGVEYLHRQDIVHRDLKPDNILMTSLEDGARAVITDFGNARFLPGKNNASVMENNRYQRMFSYVGTLEFAAPEIHKANPTIPAKEGYSTSVDMWSIGSITATLLTGDVIFTDRNHPNYYKDPRAVIVSLAAVCDLSVLDESYHPLWSVVGDRPKSFIKGLLVLEEDERMTALEALVHPWFANECHANDYENLYERSIRDWKPRQRNEQLVERIYKSVPSFAAESFTAHVVNQETVSQFFPRPQSGPTQDMGQTLSPSQRWRASTSLQQTGGNYQHAQFASQIQHSSYEDRIAELGRRHCQQPNGHIICDQQFCSEGNRDTSGYQLNIARASHETNSPRTRESVLVNSIGQLLRSNIAESSAKYSKEFIQEDCSNRSCDALHGAMNESQQQACRHVTRQPTDFNGSQDSGSTVETPFAELEDLSDNYRQLDENCKQSAFPDDHRQHQGLEKEQNSVLVLETPPDVYGNQ